MTAILNEVLCYLNILFSTLSFRSKQFNTDYFCRFLFVNRIGCKLHKTHKRKLHQALNVHIHTGTHTHRHTLIAPTIKRVINTFFYYELHLFSIL